MRRLITLTFFGILLFLLYSFGLRQGYLNAPAFSPSLLILARRLGMTLPSALPTTTPRLQTTPEQIFTKINQYRQSQNLEPLTLASDLCATVPLSEPNAVTKAVLDNCQNCTHAALITTARFISPNELLTSLIYTDNTNDSLLDPEANLICLNQSPTELYLLLIRRAANKPSVTKPPTTVQAPRPKPTSSPKNFTETELWQALTNYRQAHGRSNLELDQNLCTYARKRDDDHLTAFAFKSPADYPVPEKYPLDAHAGFSADADSGYAFDVTQKSHLAENLAYWPSAANPVQIIEWGWDTSTEGHREAQLSNDWTSGCLSGRDGFFVAIFGS